MRVNPTAESVARTFSESAHASQGARITRFGSLAPAAYGGGVPMIWSFGIDLGLGTLV